MDIIRPLRKNHSINQLILLAINHRSDLVEATTSSQTTTIAVSIILFDQLINNFGILTTVLAERGP